MMDLRKKQIEKLRMRRCYDIARLGIGAVKTNPMVGSVIVRNNKIVSEGYHQYFGGPHAEVNAIASPAARDLKDSTIYVSLEPCSHYGKTPPCADLILSKGFARCVISEIDPNPLVAGKGVERLRLGDMKITKMINRQMGQEVLKPFMIQQKHKRPYIILKWAQSRDGYLGKDDKRTKISSAFSDRLVHKWRMETDGIMVGSHTVIIDNPLLSNRLYFGKNPVRVILDREGRILPSVPIWKDDIRTFYFSSRERNFSNPMIDSFLINQDKEPLVQVFSQLYHSDIGSLLIEGGPTLLKACIKLDLWDEARVITSPVCLGNGLPAPSMVGDLVQYQKLARDQISIYARR